MLKSDRQCIVDVMEFEESARKHYAEHGITDADAIHAIRYNITTVRQRGDYEGRLLFIGADQRGRLLEVVMVPVDEPYRIIHVNILQLKNYEYL